MMRARTPARQAKRAAVPKESNMAQVDSVTRQAWQRSPRKKVDLILRLSGNVGEHAAELEAKGVEIVRRFMLTRALGVRCTGARALKLMDLPWVTSIEPDRAVQAQER
jgi:hypothetical protein